MSPPCRRRRCTIHIDRLMTVAARRGAVGSTHKQHHLKNPQMMDSVAPGRMPKIPTLWQPNTVFCIRVRLLITGPRNPLCCWLFGVHLSFFLYLSPPNILLPLAKCKPIKILSMQHRSRGAVSSVARPSNDPFETNTTSIH